MRWRATLLCTASIASPLVTLSGAGAHPQIAVPPVWFNATARQFTPYTASSNTSTCTSSECTLYLNSTAGIVPQETVSGAWFVSGSTTATSLQDGLYVYSVQGSSVTIKAQSGMIAGNSQGAITAPAPPAATLFFKNVNEFACLYDYSKSACGSLMLSSTTGSHITVAEVTDDDLSNTPTNIDAAFAGGQQGFNKLLHWMNPGSSNGINLAIVIGAPVSYNIDPIS